MCGVILFKSLQKENVFPTVWRPQEYVHTQPKGLYVYFSMFSFWRQRGECIP